MMKFVPGGPLLTVIVTEPVPEFEQYASDTLVSVYVRVVAGVTLIV